MEIATLTQQHALPNGCLTLLGAWDQVTGAMTLIESGQETLLVDCGRPIGSEARDWELPKETLKASAVLLTHGHTDHVSGLPDLLEAGFQKPIYGTAMTLELARINGRDGIRLNGGSDNDARDFCRRFDRLKETVSYNVPLRRIEGFEGQATFHDAGHIIGSASIDLVTPHFRVVLSGDLGRPGSPLLKDFYTSFKHQDKDIDLVILESTYGDKEHSRSAEDVELALETSINRALRDGGHILVPAFAIGRTQTLLYHLNTLVESGRIQDLPVAVDSPMAIQVTEIYQNSRRFLDEEAKALIREGDDPLEFDDLYAVRKSRQSRQLRDVKEPMLIIAGSGMCTGGRIVGHLQELLDRPETCVLFVGYQGRGTLGRKIQEAARRGGSVTIRGNEVMVRAETQTISGLSAHADRQELKQWVKALPQFNRIALHHGEAETQKEFASWLGNQLEHNVLG